MTAPRLVICAPLSLPSFFADDLTGTCSVCGQAVRFRPYVPASRVLVCLVCWAQASRAPRSWTLQEQAVAELAALHLEGPRP